MTSTTTALAALTRHALARRLPLSFDPAALQRAVRRVPAAWWTPHETEDSDGRYDAVSLSGPSASVHDVMYRDAPSEIARVTPAWKLCPELAAAAAAFPAPRTRVRLLRLRAGGCLLPHADGRQRLRVHVPVITNPRAYVLVENRRVPMRAGQAWWLNITRPHELFNLGDSDRVHLVIDLAPSAEAVELLRRGKAASAETLPELSIAKLSESYLRINRQARESEKPDPRRRAAAALMLARAHGLRP